MTGSGVKDAGLYFKVAHMNGLVEKPKQTAKIIEITDASIYGGAMKWCSKTWTGSASPLLQTLIF